MVPVVGAAWVCANALGTSLAPATAPAPTAAPTRNARRASSCLVICDASRSASLRPGGPAKYRVCRAVIVSERSVTASLPIGQLNASPPDEPFVLDHAMGPATL